MSNKTLVLYLENEDLKLAIQRQALAESISVSKYVSRILENSLQTKQPKNKLIKYSGGLAKIPSEERQNINQSMQDFRTSFDLNLEQKA